MTHHELVKNFGFVTIPKENRQMAFIHMAMGVSGEAGEVLELAKKWLAYGREPDSHSLIKELGDIEFYLEGLRQVIGVTREQIISENIEKLNKRYPNGTFSVKEAYAKGDEA